jgi:hypothetical protein
MNPRLTRAAAHLLLAALLAACDAAHARVLPTTSAPGAAAHAVTVDFGAPVLGARPVSGFLHSIRPGGIPDSLLVPLRPAMWRIGSFAGYGRLRALGTRVTFVLSDQWGYPSYDGSHGWPFEDWDRWEAWVRATAREHRHREVLWEVWNEPDVPRFWGGTREQFHEAYLRAHRVLREELGPGAWIGGPSLSRYDRAGLAAFLDFCARRGCEANFLTWHELGADIPGIADRLAEARRALLEEPRFAAARVRELHVGETVGEAGHLRPAEMLGTLYYLERGGADAAAKSCWRNSRGEETCHDDTLDGLLAPGTLEPAAGWWLYRAYADGADSRVRTASTSPHLVALASRGTARAGPQVLVGYMGRPGAPGRAGVRLTLRGLDSLGLPRGEVGVRVSRIPDSGEAALRAPPVVLEWRVAVRDGAASLALPPLAVHEVYVLTLTP